MTKEYLNGYYQGIRIALKAIADLPWPKEPIVDITADEGVTEGHEQAYRAVEKLYPEDHTSEPYSHADYH